MVLQNDISMLLILSPLWMQIDVLEVDGVYYGMYILMNVYLYIISCIISLFGKIIIPSSKKKVLYHKRNSVFGCFEHVWFSVAIGSSILILFPLMPLLIFCLFEQKTICFQSMFDKLTWDFHSNSNSNSKSIVCILIKWMSCNHPGLT